MKTDTKSIAALSFWKVVSFVAWGAVGFAGLLLVARGALVEDAALGARIRERLAEAAEKGPADVGRLDPEVVREGLWTAALVVVALVAFVFLVRWLRWRGKKPPERKGELKRSWFRGDKVKLPWVRLALCAAAYGAGEGLDAKPDLVVEADRAAAHAGLDALGLAFGVWAGFALAGWLARRLAVPSGARMDLWLRELIEATRDQSLSKLGLVADELTRDEIVLVGLVDDMRLIPNTDRWIRKGKDKVIRYTPLSLTILQFTERHLGVYRCTLNYIRDVQLDERTDEFYYQDVVSVATKRDSHAFTLYGTKVEESMQFSLAVSSGDRVAQTLPIGELEGFVSPVSTQAERAVNNIRQMLREKK